MQTHYSNQRLRLRPFAGFDEARDVIFTLGLIDFGHWPAEYWTVQGLKQFYEPDGLLGRSGPNFLALERLDSGAACGYMFVELPAVGQIDCEIGTMLLPEHHGLGLGVDAKQLAMCLLFEQYPLQRIHAKTLASNLPALRSLQRSGMTFRGAWRGYSARGGRRIDVHVYDIQREQWLAQDYRKTLIRGASYE